MQSIYYVSQLVGSSLMSTLTVNRPIMWVRKIIFLVNCKKTKGISKIIKKIFWSRELRKSSKQHTVYASRYVLPQEADYMGKLTVIVEIRNIFSYLTQEPIGKQQASFSNNYGQKYFKVYSNCSIPETPVLRQMRAFDKININLARYFVIDWMDQFVRTSPKF